MVQMGASNFETWHEPSGKKALKSIYKSLPWDDLGLFYGKVNIHVGRPIVKCHLKGQNMEMGNLVEDL